jgi:Glycosyltransferase 61
MKDGVGTIASDMRERVTAVTRRRWALRAVAGRIKRHVPAAVAVPSRGLRRPLTEISAMLPHDRQLTVVIAAGSTAPKRLARWLRAFSTDDVHVLGESTALLSGETGVPFERHVATDVGAIDEALKRIGSVDVLIDLRNVSAAKLEKLWRSTFFHVADGGFYILYVRHHVKSSTASWVAAAAAFDKGGGGRAARGRAQAMHSVVVTRDLVIIKKQGRHLLKLTDAETDSVLPLRERGLRLSVFATLPPGEVVSGANVVSHESAEIIQWPPRRLAYPPMHLRHYNGRIAFVGSMTLHTRSAILSESFRAHLANGPGSPVIKSVSPKFALVPAARRPTEALSGNYYLLDPQYSDHFGHIMTEVVPRLWGWDEAKRRIPDLKALFRTKLTDGAVPELECRLLKAYGIADQDIVWVDRPVWVDSLVTATSMWHNAEPYYVHPDVRETWDRLRAGLGPADAPVHDRLFVSKSRRYPARTCRNAADVEALFRAHGFTVIYPDEFDLAVQAGVFSSARVIAGFAGSAMFTMMYARNLETMILLGNEAYKARHEYLYASLLGATLHYFWSRPDIEHPEGGWSRKAFLGPWAFDFQRNGEPLKELLDTV